MACKQRPRTPLSTPLSTLLWTGLSIWALAFVLVAAVPHLASAQTLQLNQKRIQITELIQKVGEATGRTILFDDGVRGTISLVAKRPVTHEEAWQMLSTSLNVLGYSFLPSTAGMWRIAKVADAVGEAPFKRRATGDDDAFVTSLIPLRVADPAKIMPILEPLAGGSTTLIALDDARSLIASGSERRIARLMTIADALDRVEEREVESFSLRYRDVAEIEGWLESLFDSGSLKKSDLEIWSDARTNSVIYRGTRPQVGRLLGYLHRFDLPVVGEGRLQVLHVLNRDAEEVAELLRSMGQAPTSEGAVTLAARIGSRTALQERDFSISVDAATRSLIVQGDADAQAAVREALDLLDQPPQLIAVDLIVTEVRTPSVFALGFGFSIPLTAGDEQGDILGRFVSNPGGGGFAATPSAETTVVGRVDQDLNIPLFVDETTGLVIPIANTGVITAGDIDIRTEVLIEPSLVLTAGDDHELFVGNNIPVPVSGNTDLSGDTGVATNQNVLARRTTFERRDVGIKIGLEAQAGKVGPIELGLDVELSQLAPSAAGAVELVGPTFIEQKLVTSTRLQDGEFAIIALNHDTRKTEGMAGTPFLSALPFIGFLFTDRVERTEDTHLVLAARAKRVGSPSELVAHTIRKRLAFERRDAREAAMPRVEEGEPAFAVLVTTRRLEDDANAIAEGLVRAGFAAEVHSWKRRGEEVFDVYVRGLESLAEAGGVAAELLEDGWQADLVVLSRPGEGRR